jgi:hypothetical protein
MSEINVWVSRCFIFPSDLSRIGFWVVISPGIIAALFGPLLFQMLESSDRRPSDALLKGL